MNIPYKEDNDATDTIACLIDVDRNMEAYISKGLVDNPTDSYAENCENMCNISTFMIGLALSEFCEPEQLKIKEGVFGRIGNHTWIEIEGVIVDATLAQFLPYAKPLSLIDVGWAEYQAVNTYTFEEWQENSPMIL